MFSLVQKPSETSEVLLGNQAIARGALEGGVQVCAAYPGTPSSEIIGELSQVNKEANIYVEWSTNEKVAMEVAAAASFAGLRALCAMKNEGLNVALDFLAHLNLSGLGDNNGGLVVVTCDDPGGISSNSEGDMRWIARMLNLPLLEPGNAQEAKDMTAWAFEISEQLQVPCLVRSITRLSHTSGNVTLGNIPQPKRKAHFDTSHQICSIPVPESHLHLQKKLTKVQERYDLSPFNLYKGPEQVDLIIVCSGMGKPYSLEAVDILNLADSVGILSLGTTWPLPEKFILKHISKAREALVAEDVEPFLEVNLKELLFDSRGIQKPSKVYGKKTGHINAVGELTPDALIDALCQIFDLKYTKKDQGYNQKISDLSKEILTPRNITFCAGCSHRASYWAIKNALRLIGRDGFIAGDIGCYALERRPSSYEQTKTHHAMGSGAGLASGFGKLDRFGFSQPVIAACGDSTFFHAVIPALINAAYNHSNFMLAVLDNTATAMTGFQPHPGTGLNACGAPAPQIDIENICLSLGVKVEVTDPFDLKGATDKVLRLLEEDGVRIIIFRRKCELIRMREEGKQPYRVWVDAQKCIGETCGCDKYCNRIFKCPALTWDEKTGAASIDKAVCAGCGICSEICPEGAIIKEPAE